jgi:uncharacterized protein YkwD
MLAAAGLGSVVNQALADSTPTPIDQAALEARILDLTNAQRNSVGLPPLTLSPQLQGSADGYSQILASGNCFEHTCGPVPSLIDRDTAAGYVGWTSIGENLAGGYMTPESVMDAWMGSPDHRSNILSSAYTDVGISVTSGSSRFVVCWAVEFGTRDDDAAAGG